MQANREQLPTLTRRLLLQSLLFGTALAIVLLLIDGPIWLCYLAALPVAPFVVFQLLSMDRARQRDAERPRSTRDRSDED